MSYHLSSFPMPFLIECSKILLYPYVILHLTFSFEIVKFNHTTQPPVFFLLKNVLLPEYKQLTHRAGSLQQTGHYVPTNIHVRRCFSLKIGSPAISLPWFSLDIPLDDNNILFLRRKSAGIHFRNGTYLLFVPDPAQLILKYSCKIIGVLPCCITNISSASASLSS